jgi:hypothetical protein
MNNVSHGEPSTCRFTTGLFCDSDTCRHATCAFPHDRPRATHIAGEPNKTLEGNPTLGNAQESVGGDHPRIELDKNLRKLPTPVSISHASSLPAIGGSPPTSKSNRCGILYSVLRPGGATSPYAPPSATAQHTSVTDPPGLFTSPSSNNLFYRDGTREAQWRSLLSQLVA